MNIALVDDHPPLREGIKAIIERHPEFTVTGMAGGFDEGLALVREGRPDAVIVDISLPDGSGLDLIRKISTHSPEVLILVLTMHSRRQMAERAFSAGAHGYLLKESSGELLVSALEEIRTGTRVLDPRLAGENERAGCGDTGENSELGSLSPRELEVFSLLALGRSVKEIGGILGISSKTVDNHRANLMRKLCVTSIAELVRIAIRTGTIEL